MIDCKAGFQIVKQQMGYCYRLGLFLFFFKPLNKSFGIKIILGQDKSRQRYQEQHRKALSSLHFGNEVGQNQFNKSLLERLEINNQTTMQQIY